MGFLVACKNEEDPIKDEGARANPGFCVWAISPTRIGLIHYNFQDGSS